MTVGRGLIRIMILSIALLAVVAVPGMEIGRCSAGVLPAAQALRSVALGALKALGFDGAFSVHTEYEFDESIIRRVGFANATPPNLEEWARADAAYLRRIWKEV